MPNDRSPAELESDFVAVSRIAAKVDLQPTAMTTLLHIGDEQLVVLTGHGDTHETVQQIDLGAARIARDYFRHELPTPQEIERAIDLAEDEVMRLGTSTEVATTLWSASHALQVWASVSGPTMTIETIEQWKLCALTGSRVGSRRGDLLSAAKTGQQLAGRLKHGSLRRTIAMRDKIDYVKLSR